MSKSRIYFSGAVLAGCCFVALHSGLGQPSSPPASARLSGAECDRLYRHQRQIIKTDASHPLAPALRLNAPALDSDASAAAQKRYCLQNVSRDSFVCQIRSSTLQSLLRCQQQHPPGRTAPGEPAETEGEKPTEQIGTLTVQINRESCTRAYRHMLSIYESSPQLDELSNRRKLLEHWKSPAARKSFVERCLKQFRSSDLGCILATADPDVIQACLLEVPE